MKGGKNVIPDDQGWLNVPYEVYFGDYRNILLW
jgi:hypothetical protein